MGGKGSPAYTPAPVVPEVEDATGDEESRQRLAEARKREEQRRRNAARSTLNTGASGVNDGAAVVKKTLG